MKFSAFSIAFSIAISPALIGCNPGNFDNTSKIEENRENSKSYNFDLDGTWQKVTDGEDGKVFSDIHIIIDDGKKVDKKICGQQLQRFNQVDDKLVEEGAATESTTTQTDGSVSTEVVGDTIKSDEKITGSNYYYQKISNDMDFTGGDLTVKVQNDGNIDTKNDVCATVVDSQFNYTDAVNTANNYTKDTKVITLGTYDPEFVSVVITADKDIESGTYNVGEWGASFDENIVQVTLETKGLNDLYNKVTVGLSGDIEIKQIDDQRVRVEGDFRLTESFGSRRIELDSDIVLLD